MKAFLFASALFISSICLAESNINLIISDTTYYKNGGFKSSKEDADYYQIISNTGNGYLVSNFDGKINKPEMVAHCSSIDPKLVKDGMTTYYDAGQKTSEGNYENNKEKGIWTIWSSLEKDSLVVECFTDGTYKNKFVPNSYHYNTEYDVIYKMEIMPEFPGGENEMMNFIRANVAYPKKERRKGISGTCYVTFVVEKDGTITNVKILRGVDKGPGCDDESMRVVNAMPKWSPGFQYGRPVRVL